MDLKLKILQNVKLALERDIVSYAELRQITRDSSPDGNDPTCSLEIIIAGLLDEGVQIGNALDIEGAKVKFVAWKGNVGERVSRACSELKSCAERDRDFAFWFCLSSNVDEFEVKS